MTTKKTRSVSMETFPSYSFYPIGEKAKALFKHQQLIEDYEELIKGFESKRKRLMKTEQKKAKLLAEIKFLRRKLKSFPENPSQMTPYRLKKQSQETESPSLRFAQIQNPILQSKAQLEDWNHIVTEAEVPNTPLDIDLNRSPLLWEPPRLDSSKTCTMEVGGAMTDVLKICRDVGKQRNPVGKKKVKWWDELTLKE